jgi:DNA-directed RNA polymerase specialized sigma24 family protein
MERPLLYCAAKLTGNAQTAYDVLQDVWVKADWMKASAPNAE